METLQTLCSKKLASLVRKNSGVFPKWYLELSPCYQRQIEEFCYVMKRKRGHEEKVWYRKSKRRRGKDPEYNNDLPASICDGTQTWYKEGRIHRDGDQPAIIWSDGSQEWYQKGKHHRDGDQPAIIWSDGNQEWTQQWYHRGQLHRDGDQPAIIWGDGNQE